MQEIKLSKPQQLGYDWLQSHPKAALFATMGIGKTATVLQHQRDMMAEGASVGALVLAPLRVATLTWPHEVRRWFPNLKVCNLRDNGDRYRMLRGEKSHIYVLNYEAAISRDITRVRKGKTITTHHVGFIEQYFFDRKEPPAFDTVIFDELTKVKSNSSSVVKALKPYFPQLPFLIGLTGTPVPNSYLDLWGQLYAIDQGETLFKTFYQFRQAFFESDYMGYSWKLRPGAKDRIDKLLSAKCLTLRASDFMQVPDTEYVDVEVRIPQKARKQYDIMERELIVQLREHGPEIAALNGAVLVNKLLQMSGGAVYDEERDVEVLHDVRVKRLAALVKEINEPVLIACCFRHERERILEAIPACRPWDDKLLPEWNRGKIRAIVADPRSIGHGLNLQDGGSTVIWFSRNWSRETYDQFNSRVCGMRAARSGKKPVVYHLYTPDTADDAVAEALRLKEGEQSSLLAALVSLQEMRR
jgi:hypothetical protein